MAMEIIDELETCRRHVYCGSIGYISFHDTMDLSIAIRTAILAGGSLRYAVGGGIVFDSDPGAEYEETLHKGHTLMAACRNEKPPAPGPMAWLDGRLVPAGSATVPVSDLGLQYGYGFFETLRADDAGCPLLAQHTSRLQKTWEALMPAPFPDLTWAAVIDQVLGANGLRRGCAAVKILVTRGSRTAPPWDHTLLVTARPYLHRLARTQGRGLTLATYPHPRETPLAAHKTLNYLYYYLAGQWAHQNGAGEALILNPDGSVSETNTANLLLISGRRVIRPRSKAVLPGIMAEALCRRLAAWHYRIEHRPVQPAELLETDQLLAANALMGAVPVIALDGRERASGGDLWQRLNDAIIPGWR
ncbi:MAG: aminotransferase class IV [Desulfosarcinaceae bacterium]